VAWTWRLYCATVVSVRAISKPSRRTQSMPAGLPGVGAEGADQAARLHANVVKAIVAARVEGREAFMLSL
jgi:orotidine-5'-phosphate decarboxylase